MLKAECHILYFRRTGSFGAVVAVVDRIPSSGLGRVHPGESVFIIVSTRLRNGILHVEKGLGVQIFRWNINREVFYAVLDIKEFRFWLVNNASHCVDNPWRDGTSKVPIGTAIRVDSDGFHILQFEKRRA